MVTAKQSVFLFIGNDKYLKERALYDLKRSLASNIEFHPDIKIFHGGQIDETDLLDQLNTAPLLSDKRLIIIKDADEISEELRESLIRYIKKPSGTVYLVLDAQDESVLRDYGEVAKLMNVRQFGIPTGGSLITWIKNYIKANGKTIDDKALLVIKELEGNDLSYISQELDKLIAYTGGRKHIELPDVEEVLGRSLVVSVFEISNYIGRRDTSGAIRIASDLITGGKKEYEIIGVLCWHLRRMLKARIMKDRGESEYDISSALRIGRNFQDGFFRQLPGFSYEKLKADIELLLQADLDIKRSKFHPGSILEFALIRLCLA